MSYTIGMEEKLKTEAVEVPEDLKESPRERRFTGRVIFIASLIIALLFLALIFVYTQSKNAKPYVTTLPSPTPTPSSAVTPGSTDDWKKYTNTDYGFSFEYPVYLSIFKDYLPQKPTGIADDSLRISSGDYKNDLQLYIDPQFGGMCNPTWNFETKRNGPGIEFTKVKGKTNSLPDGATCSTFYTAQIITPGGKKLLINFGYDEKNTTAEKDFEKILSTFKFTK